MRMNKKEPTANRIKKTSCVYIAFVIIITIFVFSFLVMRDVSAQSENKVDEIYNKMTQEQRIAQMFMVQARDWQNQGAITVLPDDLKELYAKYKFGAFISCESNAQSILDTLDLSINIQNAVTSNGGIPMIIATEKEGGLFNQFSLGTTMSGNMALAATDNLSNANTVGQIIGEELYVLGYNCTMAPNLGIYDPNVSVSSTRYFSDSIDVVEKYAIEFSRGLKSKNIIDCIKYFPGWTGSNSNTSCPEVNRSWDELLNYELKPFISAIENGADMVMVPHVIYSKIDNCSASLSKILLTEKLRDELGFNGVICTDSMTTTSIASISSSNERVVKAINAGADLICMPLTDDQINTPEKFKQNFDALINYIDENVSDERIESAVKRILTLKEKRGILDYDESKYTEERAMDIVGCDEFKQIQRDMSANGVTLLKNDDNVLPLKLNTESKVLILVQNQNDEEYAAQFIYGYNRAREKGIVPSGVSIEVVIFDDNNWDDNDILTKIDGVDAIIINSIVSTKEDMVNQNWRILAPIKYTEYAKENTIKSIVISMDAPYDLQLYPKADALLAIYNPAGSKENWQDVLNSESTTSNKAIGANLLAATEVIFGNYGATGKLPVDIYEFDIPSTSFTNNKIYSRGDGLEYDPLTNMDRADIFLEFIQAEYSGKQICPMVLVRVDTDFGRKVLVEGKDYSLTYLNNIKVGTATIRVTGMGNYIGSRDANFEIVGTLAAPITIASILPNDFPTSSDVGWFNENEKRIYKEDDIIHFDQSVNLNEVLQNDDNNYKYVVDDRAYTFVMTSDRLTSIIVSGALDPVFDGEFFPYKYINNPISKPAGYIGDVEFIINASYIDDDDVVVKVDGDTLKQGIDYTLAHGSTHVTLKGSYVSTLSAGAHTITIGIDGYGDVDQIFEITASPSPKPKYVVPKTGVE